MNKVIFAAIALLSVTGCSASFRTAPVCDASCAQPTVIYEPAPQPVYVPPPAVIAPPPVVVAPPAVIVAPPAATVFVPQPPRRPRHQSGGEVTIGGGISVSGGFTIVWNSNERCYGYYDRAGRFHRTH